jgi:hypothetical protein
VPVLIAGRVLYGAAPAVLDVLGAYAGSAISILPGGSSSWARPRLERGACAGCKRMALNGTDWFPVVTSQLAGTAFSKVVPGGSAAAAALQARMLAQAGVAPAAIGTGLTAGALLLLGALAGLPLLALPAVLLGRHIPDELVPAAAIGLAVFVVLLVVGTLLFANGRVLRAVGRALQAAVQKLRPRHGQSDDLPERLLQARDLVRQSLGQARARALATAAGRWLFDFLSPYAALLASAPARRSRPRCSPIARRSCWVSSR